MKLPIFSLAVLSVVTLGGCAARNDKTIVHGLGLTYNSNIKRLSNGDFTAEVEASPASGRISGAKTYAVQNATEYCSARNQSMRVIKSETNSHMLINGVARLTFRCVY